MSVVCKYKSLSSEDLIIKMHNFQKERYFRPRNNTMNIFPQSSKTSLLNGMHFLNGRRD